MKEPGTNVVNAAIIGASGYSGAELLRILSTHPEVRIRRVTAASSAGQRVDALYPALAGQCDLEYEELLPEKLSDIDVAFLALPSGQLARREGELRVRSPPHPARTDG